MLDVPINTGDPRKSSAKTRPEDHTSWAFRTNRRNTLK